MHAKAIEDHGGESGILSMPLLESALAAPRNRYLYENADVAACTATYAYHLAKNHAFQDGNKRIAAYATETFILINDLVLEATNEQLYVLYFGIAAGVFTR